MDGTCQDRRPAATGSPLIPSTTALQLAARLPLPQTLLEMCLADYEGEASQGLDISARLPSKGLQTRPIQALGSAAATGSSLTGSALGDRGL